MLAELGRRRADLLRDRDPLGPRRATSPTRSRASASAARRLFALAAAQRRRARRDRHAPVGRLPRPARSSTPSTTAASSTELQLRRPAQQHLRACTSTSASAAPTARSRVVRPAAPGAAAAARGLAPTRRSSTAATAGCTRPAPQIFTRSPSRAAASPTPFGDWDAYARLRRAARARPARSSSPRRSGGRVRPHHAFGTVEVRICDAQTRRRASPRRSPALIVACVAQAALDVDEGVPFRDPRAPADRGEPLARDPLRAATGA